MDTEFNHPQTKWLKTREGKPVRLPVRKQSHCAGEYLSWLIEFLIGDMSLPGDLYSLADYSKMNPLTYLHG